MVSRNSEHIRSEYVACDLCGSVDHEILYSKIDHSTKWEFNVVKCTCGMVFVNPMLLEECIPLLYQEDYHSEKPLLDSLYQSMMAVLPKPNGSGKLLDIGCGGGDFIRYAAKAGWDCEGIDFIDWNRTDKDINVRVGNFLTMDIPEESYDVITAWAVLEHVRHPSLFFGKISKLLARDGRFIFTVPNVGAPGMSHSCHEDVPKHLWLFTTEAVNTYLSRHGLKAESILHNGKIYRTYPFGLVRYGYHSLISKAPLNAAVYENKSIALLKNRPIDIYFGKWISEVFRQVSPLEIVVDALDLALGLTVANVSKILNNYGVITVIASKTMSSR